MNRIHFQRRHGQNCPAGHPPFSRTDETAERRKGTVRCSCPIYATGTLEGEHRRMATKVADWPTAHQIIQPYIDAGSWKADDRRTPPPPPEPPVPPVIEPEPEPPSEKLVKLVKLVNGPGRTPISEAITSVLRWQRSRKAADGTLKKYREVLCGKDGLEAYAARENLNYLEEIEPTHIRKVVESWDVEPGTCKTKLSILKPFFQPFVEDRILYTNPARITLPTNRASRGKTNRIPFAEAELERMFRGCETYGHNEPRRWPKKKDGRTVVAITDRREYNRKFDGSDVADFLELSIETGLRCTDVAKFNITRLTPNGEVKLRATKNGIWVCVLVSDELQKIIRDRAIRFGPYIFGDPTGRTDSSVYQVWRDRLEALWAQTGPWDQKPVHHRFRHTFVRRLLENDTKVSIVAHLIGDSEETVRKHYSNWVPELQNHITGALKEVRAKMPRLRREVAR